MEHMSKAYVNMCRTIIIYRGLLMVDATYNGVILKTTKTCQLKYFIEHMMRTIVTHKKRE